jgi:KDO2-lipid IV(A) lauroyltransferase
VQEKMASRNRLVRTIASVGTEALFPLASWMARRLPRRLMATMCRASVGFWMKRRRKYMRAIRENYAVILGRPADSTEVRRTASRMIDTHFEAWLDFLRYASRRPEEALAILEDVEGYAHLRDGLARGKGVLLLTAHMGNWEMGGLLLATVRLKVHVVLVPDIFPGVERARRRLHEGSGVGEIRVDRSIVPTLAIMRALAGNGIVAMQGDRDFDNTGVPLPFFDREAFFPRGPLRVAMATGATVLPSFILRTPSGRYRAIIGAPLPIDTGPDRDAALRRNLERYVAILEERVRATPEQWYCFYPFWDDPSRRMTRSTPAAAPSPPPRRTGESGG